MKILNKTNTFRFSESTYSLLEKAKENHVKISRFVREAISEKFERDFPKWIEEQNRKQKLIECPF